MVPKKQLIQRLPVRIRLFRALWKSDERDLRQQRENKLPVAGVARLRASRFKTEFWRIRLRPQVLYYPANA